MDAAAEPGRNLVSKHHIQPEYKDEQDDAGRDCRTRLARPNSQARTRTGEKSFFPVQLTTSRIGNLTRMIHTTLAISGTIHYIVLYCTVLYVIRKCYKENLICRLRLFDLLNYSVLH